MDDHRVPMVKGGQGSRADRRSDLTVFTGGSHYTPYGCLSLAEV